MSRIQKILSFIGAATVIAAIGVFVLVSQEPGEAQGFARILDRHDVLGSGTTTADTYNSGSSAATTSSDVLLIGEAADLLDLDIFAEDASSTAHVNIQVVKSSLDNCGSNTHDEFFVDANPQISASGNALTLNDATTTWYWKPSDGDAGTSIQLTNLNAKCAKVYVGAEDVNLYIQGVTKSLNF